MEIRDRVKDLRRVRAGSLRPNPRNWRAHPSRQQDALRGVLAEVGFASAIVARELEDGSLEIIDGHLRAETVPDAEVPVVVLDVDEREAAYLLATMDPLAALAEANAEALDLLLGDVNSGNPAVQELIAEAADAAGLYGVAADPMEPSESPQKPVEARLQIPPRIWLTAGEEIRDELGRAAANYGIEVVWPD